MKLQSVATATEHAAGQAPHYALILRISAQNLNLRTLYPAYTYFSSQISNKFLVNSSSFEVGGLRYQQLHYIASNGRIYE